jgi:molybdate transport system ATP-binding protein
MSTGALSIRVRLPLARFSLDVEIETGARSLGLFGPSGAGKTTVLEAIAGWRTVREGRIDLGGRTVLDAELGIDVEIAERGIGYVPQDALLFPHWNVEGNIRAGERRARGLGAKAVRAGAPPPNRTAHDGSRREFEQAVSVLELESLLGRSTRSLSGGERQRVALARALCSSPRFLMLDEPLGALDLPLRRRILPYLIRVRESYDLPMIFVSHDATEVQALCDEVAVMREGRVVECGPASSVLGRPAHRAPGFENVVRGVVLSKLGGTAQIEIAPGVAVHVPGAGLRAGSPVLFSLGADEILISRTAIEGISARNILPARVESLVLEGEDALLDTTLCARSGAEGSAARLSVNLTRASARELELAAGARVHLVFKTQSCRVLSNTADEPASGA